MHITPCEISISDPLCPAKPQREEANPKKMPEAAEGEGEAALTGHQAWPLPCTGVLTATANPPGPTLPMGVGSKVVPGRSTAALIFQKETQLCP